MTDLNSAAIGIIAWDWCRWNDELWPPVEINVYNFPNEVVTAFKVLQQAKQIGDLARRPGTNRMDEHRNTKTAKRNMVLSCSFQNSKSIKPIKHLPT